MNLSRLMRIKDEGSFKRGSNVRATLPTGRKLEGTYVEEYAPGKHTVKGSDGKFYGVGGEYIEQIVKERAKREPKRVDPTIASRRKNASELKRLKREQREVELEMEDELSVAAQLASRKNGTDFTEEMEKIAYDGNNPIVKKYANKLNRIYSKIEKLQSQL